MNSTYVAHVVPFSHVIAELLQVDDAVAVLVRIGNQFRHVVPLLAQHESMEQPMDTSDKRTHHVFMYNSPRGQERGVPNRMEVRRQNTHEKTRGKGPREKRPGGAV